MSAAVSQGLSDVGRSKGEDRACLQISDLEKGQVKETFHEEVVWAED